MQKLDAAIQKAAACGAYSALVTASAAVLASLQAELEVNTLYTHCNYTVDTLQTTQYASLCRPSDRVSAVSQSSRALTVLSSVYTIV
jgi:hypothetical protein